MAQQTGQELAQLYQLAHKYPKKFVPVTAEEEKPQSCFSSGEKVEVTVRKARESYFAPAQEAEEESTLAKILPTVASLLSSAKATDIPPTPVLLTPENLGAAVTSCATDLTPEEESQAVDRLHAELFGLGPLEPLLEIEGITDIFVNSPTDIWIEAAGQLQKTTLSLESEQEVRALATRLLTSAGARLDDAHPSADAYNDRGQRIHAVLPPLSRGSTVLSIRIQPQNRASLADLQAAGMFGEEVGLLLRYIVNSKKNFLISGGTGSGKTTLLNALLGECGADERLVIIEDSAELAPVHPHLLSLQTRPANAEGRGEVTLSELIRQSLRMRPSRLVLGECRGAELADMLTAMNTGHSGTGGTLHANSAEAVPARLYAMGALAGLSAQALALQAATAVDFIIHISREGGQRFVAEIVKLVRAEGELKVERFCWFEKARRRNLLTFSPEALAVLEAVKNHEKE